MRRTLSWLISGFAFFLSVAPANAQDNLWEKYLNLGTRAEKESQFDEAERQFNKALREAESFDIRDPRLGKTLDCFARLFHDQGKYSQAETVYKKTLEFVEKVQGADHPNFAKGLNSLATLYTTQARYSEAEPLSKEP